MSIITLTTDFGLQDHYVAAMKGVILQMEPKAILVDITHEIAAHNVLQAAFAVRQAWPWFPAGTVHLVVVDPGVGTARRILAGRYGGQFFVAPDNGVISLVHQATPSEGLYVVECRPRLGIPPSATFQGRDIMAPVAAMLARGRPLHELGPPTDHLEVLSLPRPHRNAHQGVEGEVLYVDRFGNCITNIPRVEATTILVRNRQAEAVVGEKRIGPLRHTYAEVPQGQPVLIVGSTDMLEIAVNRGRASEVLGVGVGSKVVFG